MYQKDKEDRSGLAWLRKHNRILHQGATNGLQPRDNRQTSSGKTVGPNLAVTLRSAAVKGTIYLGSQLGLIR